MTAPEILPNRVYYIEFIKITDEKFEEEVQEEMLNLFKSIMDPDECVLSVIFGDNDSIFTFLDSDKVNKILELSINLGILKTYRDISDDILKGNYIDDNFKKTFSNSVFYKNVMVSYIKKNLTTDIVLDKINENGIDSLSLIDFKTLQGESLLSH